MPSPRNPNSGKPRLTQNQGALVMALITAFCAWVVPGLSQALLPLQYLNTHFHEMSHAIVGCLTGATVEHIEVHQDGSGVTPMLGGNFFLIASAGYVGATAIGGFVAACGRSPQRAQWVLGVLTLGLATSMLLWVRGDGVGIASGWIWVLVLGLLTFTLRGFPLLFVVQFLGLELALASFQSLWVLLKVSAITNLQSDAKIAEHVSGVPAIFWAVCWSLLGLVTTVAAVRYLWQPDPESDRWPGQGLKPGRPFPR